MKRRSVCKRLLSSDVQYHHIVASEYILTDRLPYKMESNQHTSTIKWSIYHAFLHCSISIFFAGLFTNNPHLRNDAQN